jgi:hypothetical protein
MQPYWMEGALLCIDAQPHIMLETPEPNLVVGMQWLQSTYTKRFNVSRTTVSNEWLSKGLFSGHPSNISNYVKSVNDDKSRATRKMIRKVLKSQD